MNDQNPPSIFLFAGEPSGDMYGAHLVDALKKQYPTSLFSGVAGPQMREKGVAGEIHTEQFSVMGFTDVIRVLPRLWRQFQQIRNQILEQSPRAVIFIDSPSLSLRMAKALRKSGYKRKIIQYISPTVWAWGKKRRFKMERYFDLLLTIYPFESSHFTDTQLPVQYIGHPLVEIMTRYTYAEGWQEKMGIDSNRPLVALFPGSRRGEILRNLPKQLDAAALLKAQCPEVQFAISCANEGNRQLIEQSLNTQASSFYLIPKEYTYELMQRSRAAIAKSGTVTLELALHSCPTVVSYELTTLNKWIAKYILKVNLPYYCIVNILLEKTVFPELIGRSFTAQDLFAELKPLYLSGQERDQCLQTCQALQQMLAGGNASKLAAAAITQLLQDSI